MAEPGPSPRLRVVGLRESAPRGGKGPGLAVIAVALYALLFLGALLFLWSRVPNRRGEAPSAAAAPAAPAAKPDRLALLSGEGLAPDARFAYARLLSADCCDCGCELTLRQCLATDAKCSRSAEIASQRAAELQ
ncbi:MAG: hypothetical protein ACRD3M_06845 [Thermoanaerobaculia bacterium]